MARRDDREQNRRRHREGRGDWNERRNMRGGDDYGDWDDRQNYGRDEFGNAPYRRDSFYEGYGAPDDFYRRRGEMEGSGRGRRERYGGAGGMTYPYEDSMTRRPYGGYAAPYGRRRDYDRSDDDRGFFEKAGDEVASWFGDEDAERRREADQRGRGPRNYQRSDSRIEEDVNDRLTDDSYVDASDITVSVKDSEVTLDGHVTSRRAKRRAEDCCDSVSGVTHVQNNLRVKQQDMDSTSSVTGTS
ncbi:BON domain-containing protein [Marivita sp. GX14005]|uniref:BON domain-containing protein n=1 Tax=Marivita sp. GX14005 TaxID=2942276 RepID=UPI00201842B1|nr:BON domain-containing protein [Marivita sp. GX14005]MCL3883729.1 BON domain-containing protein [Marivita sp. GX14005]